MLLWSVRVSISIWKENEYSRLAVLVLEKTSEEPLDYGLAFAWDV